MATLLRVNLLGGKGVFLKKKKCSCKSILALKVIQTKGNIGFERALVTSG